MNRSERYMIRTARAGLLAVGCCLSATAAAADFDGSTPLVCASMEAFECDAGGVGCRAVTPESIAAPRFVKLDLKKGELISSRRDQPDKLPPVTHAGGRLILQAVIGKERPDNEGLAWTLSINETSGDLVLSAAADEAAFVIFGACTKI
jgi:hypothetical protein